MIANERQLQIARADVERFEAALTTEQVEGVDSGIAAAQREAISSQLDELRREIDSYLELRRGNVRTFEFHSLADLPDLLIKARIAAGMTQRDLAERLSLKEQQIQRYEAQGYQGASFARIVDVADAIGIDIPSPLRLVEAESPDAVLKRAAVAGVDSRLVRSRVAPDGDAHQVAKRLAFVYGWSPSALFRATPLELPIRSGSTARFKMPKGRNERATAAYTAYAHRLASICAGTRPSERGPDLPVEAAAMRAMVASRGPVNFENVLETAWDLGIIVLPLADPGHFHGACWRIGWVNVVVLKQGDRSISRWLVDLLHEMFHAGRFPELRELEVVEEPEVSDSRREDVEERQATWFASLVATDGRAEELFKAAVSRTGGDLRHLKLAVTEVASRAKIDPGILANYAAFRLSLQGENWWGTAANLQDRSRDPLEIARDTFFRRFDFSPLDETELELLTLALHDEVKNG